MEERGHKGQVMKERGHKGQRSSLMVEFCLEIKTVVSLVCSSHSSSYWGKIHSCILDLVYSNSPITFSRSVFSFSSCLSVCSVKTIARRITFVKLTLVLWPCESLDIYLLLCSYLGMQGENIYISLCVWGMQLFFCWVIALFKIF